MEGRFSLQYGHWYIGYMDLSGYEITGLHRNLRQCLVKQEVSPKCIARYISIITADCMMQCAMEKRVQYVYDYKYG